MKIAYLDCFSGVSGDMLLGALIDAGLPAEELTRALDRLNLSGFRLEVEAATASSLKAVRVQVRVEEKQPLRHLQDIEQILAGSSIDPPVREKSLAIFRRLAKAEAEVHGCSVDTVHFHEVGGVDALVDVVGAVSGFHLLGIDRIYCSSLPMPHGWVACAHGELPVPAPAVCILLQNVPVYGENLSQELVTPTGAAIVRELAEEFGTMPPMIPAATGYGAGGREREDGRPNLLRLLIGEPFSPAEAQQVEVIETAVDDWSPEGWPHVAEKLLAGGALDVLLTPVQMKKGRPGFMLRVVCDPAQAETAKNILLSETGAIGLRWHREQRRTLHREIINIQTRWGAARAKKIETPAGTVITPEYEDCRRLATDNRVPLKQIYEEVVFSARNTLSS